MAAVGVAAAALCYAGLSGLCLAMGRSQQRIWTRSLSARMSLGLRTSGWLLLGFSVVACVDRWGGSVGVVAWCGLISFMAATVALLLTYAPRWISVTAVTTATVGLLFFLMGS